MDTQRFIGSALLAPHPLASTAGRDVLAQGGSALEAAAAAFLVSCVVQGQTCGLGGDAIWIVREPTGKVHVIDGSGMAGGRRERRALSQGGPR